MWPVSFMHSSVIHCQMFHTRLGCFYFHKLPGFDDRLRRSSFYPQMGGSYKTVFRKPLIWHVSSFASKARESSTAIHKFWTNHAIINNEFPPNWASSLWKTSAFVPCYHCCCDTLLHFSMPFFLSSDYTSEGKWLDFFGDRRSKAVRSWCSL